MRAFTDFPLTARFNVDIRTRRKGLLRIEKTHREPTASSSWKSFVGTFTVCIELNGDLVKGLMNHICTWRK